MEKGQFSLPVDILQTVLLQEIRITFFKGKIVWRGYKF